MRIDGNRAPLTGLPVAPDAAAGQARPGTTAGPTLDNRFEPSAQLVDLTRRATLDSEVRPDRLVAVAERLSQGYYATDAAAAGTADALLGAAD